MFVGDPTGATVEQVEIDPNLMAVQQEDIWQLLNEHASIFTDHPDLIEHCIKLLSDKPIQLKQYLRKF